MRIASPEYNLHVLYPDIAGQWHPTKNGDLRPENLTPRSGRKTWWICDKGHAWKTVVRVRTRGSQCPYCSGRVGSPEYNLLTSYPDIARQWHPTKNASRKPEEFTPGSGKKAWWYCDFGHEWEAAIGKRTGGTGCPYCVRQGVVANNYRFSLRPEKTYRLGVPWGIRYYGSVTPSKRLLELSRSVDTSGNIQAI
jgi:hypothetical protein